jgi:predicted secreted protein
MRSDPSDNGGLFVGRRPGTAPIVFREALRRGSEVRRRIDGSLASMLLAAIAVVSLFCRGPVAVAWEWLGSGADYLSGNVSLGIVASFAALFALLFGPLSILRRLDLAWILVRRAAGHDQRSGALGRTFAATAAICAIAFALWFFVIHGPGYGAPDLRVP